MPRGFAFITETSSTAKSSDFFGTFGFDNRNFYGKLVFGCRLVKTAATTIPEQSLKSYFPQIPL